MSRSILSPGQAKLTVRRSKFLALAFPAESLDEVQAHIKAFRAKHRRARHICWACRIPGPGDRIEEQMRDDGEVGRPGLVMLELLRRRDLAGGVVVARIFGGVKLGVGGVSRAFREAAEAAVDGAKV